MKDVKNNLRKNKMMKLIWMNQNSLNSMNLDLIDKSNIIKLKQIMDLKDSLSMILVLISLMMLLMEIGKDGYTHLLSPDEILMPKWFSLGFKLTKNTSHYIQTRVMQFL